MVLNPLSLIRRRLNALGSNVKQHLRRWTKPDNQSLALNAILDLTRTKSELVLENALLRQQLIVLQRHVKRPALSWRDRALFVFIASKLPTWNTALMIVQPDTLLRWHRDLFRLLWRRKSKRKGRKGREPLSEDIVALIKTMANDNRTWGAECIRGELLKLGIQVAKSTIQRYINQVRSPLPPSRRGPRSFATMPRTSGLLTSCRPMTCSSAPSLSLSSLNSVLVACSISA
jgi:putative transposase